MSLAIVGTFSALAAGGLFASFAGRDGTPPYTYAVLPNGAGGSIDASSGAYSSPAAQSYDPKKAYDTIQVTDADAATATVNILIAPVLGLVCEIIQKEMGLADGRVYIYDQKIEQPTDSGLYVAVGILQSKPFANTIKFDSVDADNMSGVGSINVLDTLMINVISRSNEALFRKEEVLLALGSLYSNNQQQANSFYIAKLPPGGQFMNLSEIDGAAIPYRFNISINVQYFRRLTKSVPFFDDFGTPEITTES